MLLSQVITSALSQAPAQYGKIGIELTKTGGYIAQVRHHNGQTRWANCQEVRLEATAETGATTWRHASLAKASGHLLDELIGFEGSQITLALPFDETALSLHALPAAEPREIKEMLRLEGMEDQHRSHLDHCVNWPTHVPFPWHTPGLSHHWQYRCSSTQIAQVLRQIQRQGMECTHIDPLPFALARSLLTAGYDSSTRPMSILHLADDQTLFIVVEQGVPVYIRSLKELAYGTLVEEIQQEFSVSQRCARNLLLNVGLSGATHSLAHQDPMFRRATPQHVLSAEIYVVIARHLTALTSELEKTLRFIHSELTRPLWPNIVVTGIGGTIGELQEWSLSTHEFILTPWRFPEGAQVVPVAWQPAYALATGLSCLDDNHAGGI